MNELFQLRLFGRFTK